jgi:hypothetical protein
LVRAHENPLLVNDDSREKDLAATRNRPRHQKPFKHNTPPILITTDYPLAPIPSAIAAAKEEVTGFGSGPSDDHLSAMQMKEAWAVLGLPCNATPLQVTVSPNLLSFGVQYGHFVAEHSCGPRCCRC